MLLTGLKISHDKGTGKAARQRAIVQGRITDGTLFPNISAKIIDHIVSLIDDTFSSLHEKVNNILGFIRADLDMAVGATRKRHVVTARERQQQAHFQKEVERLEGVYAQMIGSLAHLE